MIINPEYINAITEIVINENKYKNADNLPILLKKFISIAKDDGLHLEVNYGLVNNVSGFVISINGKGEFLEDYLVEDESKFEQGIEWFKKSLKETFNK